MSLDRFKPQGGIVPKPEQFGDWRSWAERIVVFLKKEREREDLQLNQKLVGEPFPVWDHIADPPVNSGSALFIKLTAGENGAGQYNENLLINESVSGSMATAEVSVNDSPLDGQTVHLINTEERYVRAGTSSGVGEETLSSGAVSIKYVQATYYMRIV